MFFVDLEGMGVLRGSRGSTHKPVLTKRKSEEKTPAKLISILILWLISETNYLTPPIYL
jgi:hypothetical protein